MKKLIAIAIGLSIVSYRIIPVFATEATKNNQSIVTQVNYNNSASKKLVLTLDKAISATINNSDKLALKQKEIAMYEKKLDLQEYNYDYNDEIGDNTSNDTIDDFQYDKLDLQKSQAYQSEDFFRDQIANDTTNKYNAIILKQLDIDKLKFDLEIKTKDFNIMKTKVRTGFATSNQLYDKQIEVKKAQDNISAKEDSLKNNIDYLGILTNLDLSNYTLDKNINYNVFKIDGSIDEYLNDKINQYLKYNDEIVKRTDDYLHELKKEKIDDIKDTIDGTIAKSPKQSSYIKLDENNNTVCDTIAYSVALMKYEQTQEKVINKYSSYLDSRYSTDEAKVTLEDSKNKLKNTLKEMYSILLDLENQIDALKEEIKSTNIKIKCAKLKVDIETTTENDYKAQVLKSEELDISLRNLINTYNKLKDNIQKPWILSSN